MRGEEVDVVVRVMHSSIEGIVRVAELISKSSVCSLVLKTVDVNWRGPLLGVHFGSQSYYRGLHEDVRSEL